MKFKNSETKKLFEQVISLQDTETNDKNLREIVFNISETCNFNCVYCFANGGTYGNNLPKKISFNTVKTALDYLLPQNSEINAIKLFGGEPFLNLGIIEETLDYINNYNLINNTEIRVYTITNGSIFNEKICSLFDKGLQVTISIDGPKKINDSLRVTLNKSGTYDNITNNISNILKIGYQINGLDITYTPLHAKYNYTYIDIIKYFYETFKLYAHITPTYWPNDDFDIDSYAKIIYRNSYELGKESVSKLDFIPQINEMCFDILKPRSNDVPWCGLGTNSISVMADGSILPCYTLYERKNVYKIGKINQAGLTLDTSSQIIENFQNMSPRTSSNCKCCDIASTCRGCPGSSLYISNKLTGDNIINCSGRMGLIEGYLEEMIRTND